MKRFKWIKELYVLILDYLQGILLNMKGTEKENAEIDRYHSMIKIYGFTFTYMLHICYIYKCIYKSVWKYAIVGPFWKEK